MKIQEEKYFTPELQEAMDILSDPSEDRLFEQAGIFAVMLYMYAHGRCSIRNGDVMIDIAPFEEDLERLTKLECNSYYLRMVEEDKLPYTRRLYLELVINGTFEQVGDFYANALHLESFRDEFPQGDGSEKNWKRAMRIYLILKSEYDPSELNRYRRLSVRELKNTGKEFEDDLNRMANDEFMFEYPIRNAMYIYQKLNIPMRKLLEDYAIIRQHINALSPAWKEKKAKKFNPWKHVFQDDPQAIESGLSDMEKAFNDGAWKMRYSRPVHVIELLFSTMDQLDVDQSELMLLQRDFPRERTIGTDSPILIINPSALFIHFYLPDRIKKADPNKQDGHVTFVINDEIIRQLYTDEYPSYRFVSMEQALEERTRYRKILILSRRTKLEQFYGFADLLDDGAEFHLTAAEHYLRDDEFHRLFQEKNLEVNAIAKYPVAYLESRHAKMMILKGHKRRSGESPSNQVGLISEENIRESFYLTGPWDAGEVKYHIPADHLWKGESLAKVLQSIKRVEAGLPVVAEDRSCSIFELTKEIRIPYCLMEDRKRRYSAQVHYCEILDEKSTRKKGKILVKPTERGLRAMTAEEVLQRLPEVPFRPKFYDVIRADVERIYDLTRQPLTLGSLCFCCWSSMPDRTLSFDERYVKKLIFGHSRALTDIVPEYSSVQEIQEALMEVRENGRVYKKDWIQLNLILNAAVQQGLLETNVLVISTLIRSMEGKNSVHILNAALKKAKFLDEEEDRMVAYMHELVLDPRTGKKAFRYCRDSLTLVAAIQLFSGMPIREICALTWQDLSQIDVFNAAQLSVTKHMDGSNHVVSNREYGHGRRHRLVALPYFLSKMLLTRRQYLLEELHADPDELKSAPIILSQEPGMKGARRKDLHATRQQALKASKQVLAEAQIDSKIMTLLDGDARFDVDLNAAQNDLFASNFRWKAYIAAGFTDGELAYHVGNVPPDTFSGHYCDYRNKFVQLMLSSKLDRWADRYRRSAEKTDNEMFMMETVTSDWKREFAVGAEAGVTVQADLSLLPRDQTDAVAEITLYAKRGMKVTAKTYEK